MASDGLIKRAKTGKCRMCQRVRNTNDQVKAVGEVLHGYATGHIWECKDVNDCEKAMELKLKKYHPESNISQHIELMRKIGRATLWISKN